MMTQDNSGAAYTEPEYMVIDKACKGNTSAYDELVTRYRARAVRVARSFIRDRDLAEDIAQEAFVRTFLTIHRLKAPGAFSSYLTRTIVRLCVDHFRKSSSHETPIEIDYLASDDGMPKDETLYIQSIIAQLSVKLRVVIVLRDVNGMDYETIARTLDLPIGTVRSRLAAARASFKALYLGGIAAEREA